MKTFWLYNSINSFRPPPKIVRRVGPVAESPSVTETPPSPSISFNQSVNNTHCSSDSNVKPSEFLRHKHNDEKLSSVLLKYTKTEGNVTKSGHNSSSESLINNASNEEILQVESYPISERVKQEFYFLKKLFKLFSIFYHFWHYFRLKAMNQFLR